MQARHGGDIYRHNVKIDFSVNINPLGMDEHVKESIQSSIIQCDRYPDLECLELRRKIADRYSLLEDEVICGNGASDLFMAIARSIQPDKALLTAPSFFGYEHALRAVNCEILYERLKEENDFQLTDEILYRLTDDIDIVFLCSPNNPTGQVITSELLGKIVKKCEENEIYLVVDQCFLEFTGEYKRYGAEQFLKNSSKLIIVNAFTKTFAIPGIRLGYAFGNAAVISIIKSQLSEWNVSIPAIACGLGALETYKTASPNYMERAIELLKTERLYLKKSLEKLSIKVFPSKADYLLLKTEIPLYDRLLEKGILIRHCNNYVGLDSSFYRIAVKTHEQNEQLIESIRALEGREDD